MTMKYLRNIVLLLAINSTIGRTQNLELNSQGYFEMQGLNVTVFSDIYPDGHQTGVTVIQHGVRTVANGDLRLEVSPGQWSPMPKGGKQIVDRNNNRVTQQLWYPDSSKNMKGFNPIKYPDLTFKYSVSVQPLEGSSFKLTVDLEKELPIEWVDKIGFNIEIFPGDYFGKTYSMNGKSGFFTQQPNGPMYSKDQKIAEPLAVGNKLIIAPEDLYKKVTFTSESQIELWDGRTNHNNGWFIVRSNVIPGKTKGAVEMVITPNVLPNWKYKPVIHVSQVGYHTKQEKVVVVELDKNDDQLLDLEVEWMLGTTEVKSTVIKPQFRGDFLRYKYLKFIISDTLMTNGIYQVKYGDVVSNPFIVSDEIYDRHVWQPTLEYFLPVQMCHMRVNEKYRCWHGHCHKDDALMAPIDTNHFDGYVQGPSTLTEFNPLDPITGLNAGGWHDAGDYDLRVESQIGTIWNLALMIEEFELDYDATSIDQSKNLVEIHQPDGKNDAIQQIEHGLLSVLGSYRSLGRLYRGIICSDLKQYTLLGDASVMTDGKKGNSDDRWVFTEENANRELYAVGGLAAASRALKATNPVLSAECIESAMNIWNTSNEKANNSSKIIALSELILATHDKNLIDEFIKMKATIIEDLPNSGWAVGHVIHCINQKRFIKDLDLAVESYVTTLVEQSKETPFGVPYRPNIWGAGWAIQKFGRDQYFFNKGWPNPVSKEFYVNAFNFVLGVHPGENTMSFVSGVGSESATVAYGVNRADWSFIPGGSISGTALIRPDLPELKIWPYFWQQTEYVMGGGATNYMFLAMAVQHTFNSK